MEGRLACSAWTAGQSSRPRWGLAGPRRASWQVSRWARSDLAGVAPRPYTARFLKRADAPVDPKSDENQRPDPGSSCSASAFLCTSARWADRGPRAGGDLRSGDDLRQSPVGRGDQGHRIRSGLQRQQCCATGMDLPHTSRWRGRVAVEHPDRRWSADGSRGRSGHERAPGGLRSAAVRRPVAADPDPLPGPRSPAGRRRQGECDHPALRHPRLRPGRRERQHRDDISSHQLLRSPGRLCRPQRRGRLRPQLDGSATLPRAAFPTW